MRDESVQLQMEARIARLRQLLLQQGLDALVVSHPLNRRYLSSIPADDPQPGETPGWLVVGKDRAFALITSSNYDEAKDQASHLEVMRVEAPIAGKVAFETAKLLSGLDYSSIGFEQDALTFRWYDELARSIKAGQQLLPTKNIVETLRQQKDETELALVKRACDITSEAFASVMNSVGPGITERELVWELESAMRKAGAEAIAFDIIVAAGPGGATPHHTPEDRPIQAHEPVIIDMGARVEGYAADMTRTICFGEAPRELKEQYDLVEAALAAAIERGAPGQSGNYVCARTEEIMSASKHHRGFKAGIGHGIGLAVHEPPHLKSDEFILQENMVIAIEPAVYALGWGGIRLEDTVQITPAGGKRLTTASFKLEY